MNSIHISLLFCAYVAFKWHIRRSQFFTEQKMGISPSLWSLYTSGDHSLFTEQKMGITPSLWSLYLLTDLQMTSPSLVTSCQDRQSVELSVFTLQKELGMQPGEVNNLIIVYLIILCTRSADRCAFDSCFQSTLAYGLTYCICVLSKLTHACLNPTMLTPVLLRIQLWHNFTESRYFTDNRQPLIGWNRYNILYTLLNYGVCVLNTNI